MSDARQWLEFAEEDQKAAEVLLRTGLYSQACFLCQQGAEKSLKGFLQAKRGRFRKTHSLLELQTFCKEEDSDFSAILDECMYLDRFYLVTRYPNASGQSAPEGMPGKMEAEKALTNLGRIIELVRRKSL